jgi:hypothetical protein
LLERPSVERFLDAHKAPPQEIVLDRDATQHPLYGDQVSCSLSWPSRLISLPAAGRVLRPHLLAAKLRRSNVGGRLGRVGALGYPDPGALARDPVAGQFKVWAPRCATKGVPKVLAWRATSAPGRHHRQTTMTAAAYEELGAGRPARRFADFGFAKAERLLRAPAPDSVVTSLPAGTIDACALYKAGAATCSTIPLKLLKIGAQLRIVCTASRSPWAGPAPTSQKHLADRSAPHRLLSAPKLALEEIRRTVLTDRRCSLLDRLVARHKDHDHGLVSNF